MSDAPIRAVGVVVPARDEEDLIGPCLHSVRRALRALPPHVTTAVTVVLDRCRDRTPHRVTALLTDWPEASALRVTAVGTGRTATVVPTPSGIPERAVPVRIVRGRGVGALRHLGVEHTLDRLRGHPPGSTWLLSTDADTTVPPDWAGMHLRLAAAGAAGIAGIAELDGVEGLSPQARHRYRRIVRDGTDGAAHRHVYGANLGVRADAYLATGGFPVDGSGEDHGLWERLRAAGYPLEQPTGVAVSTSARTRGRATGGLADLLHALHAPAPSRPAQADERATPRDIHGRRPDGPASERGLGDGAGGAAG